MTLSQFFDAWETESDMVSTPIDLDQLAEGDAVLLNPIERPDVFVEFNVVTVAPDFVSLQRQLTRASLMVIGLSRSPDGRLTDDAGRAALLFRP